MVIRWTNDKRDKAARAQLSPKPRRDKCNQTKISLGDRSTSRRGTLVAVITCPGLPGHFGLFS